MSHTPVRRRIWPVVRKVWVTLGIGATVVFVTWSLIAYRASGVARDASVSGDAVLVGHSGGTWSFTPDGGSETAARLIFVPGALVDPRAYAPLARAVAEAGYPVTIVEMPRRGAFGGAESAELDARIRALLSPADGRPTVVGGHSRGAVVASHLVAGSGSTVDGLLLIGTSHPRDVDLSSASIPVTKIVGSRDGLASPAEVRANEGLLPDHTRWTWIEGGNHSQFGWYGFQPMDRRPRIAASEQRRIMLDAVLELMRSVSEAREGAGQAGLDAWPRRQR